MRLEKAINSIKRLAKIRRMSKCGNAFIDLLSSTMEGKITLAFRTKFVANKQKSMNKYSFTFSPYIKILLAVRYQVKK